MSNTWFVDFNNGNDSSDGADFSDRVKTLNRASVLASPGDTVRVMGNAPTTSGTASWTNGSPLVTLSSPLSQALYTDGLWTSSNSGVSVSTVTSFPTPREGSNCVQLSVDIGGGVITLAYWPLGSSQDLSAYQQISLWLYASGGTISSGELSVNLCSDAAGLTVVNSMTINQVLNGNTWTCMTLNNGAALGSSIQSISVSSNSIEGEFTLSIDNVVACAEPTSAGCLTLNTLISPDGLSWYPIQSINGTSVYIDALESTAAGLANGFALPSVVNGTLYLLQPTVSLSTSGAYAQTFEADGTAGNQITISGGWDTTAMSVQDGWTTIDLMDWTGGGLDTADYNTVDHFNFVRWGTALEFSTGFVASNCNIAGGIDFSTGYGSATLSNCNFINTYGQSVSSGAVVSNSNFYGSMADGLDIPASASNVTVTGCNASGSSANGFRLYSPFMQFVGNTANGNQQSGFFITDAYDFVAYGLTAHGNLSAGVLLSNATVEIYGLDTNTPGGSSIPQIYADDNNMSQVVVNNWVQYTGTSPPAVLTDQANSSAGFTGRNVVASHRENGIAADNSLYTDFGLITTTGVPPHGGTGIAWSLAPNANAFSSAPLRLSVAKVACPASVATSITFWAQLSAASGINAQFRVFGGRYPGVGSVGSDVITTVSGTSWAQYTVSVTPTAACVVEIFFEAWGSTTQTAIVGEPSMNTGYQNALSYADQAAPFVLQSYPAVLNPVYQAAPFLLPLGYGAIFTPDQLGRLTNVTLNTGHGVTYTYDKVGNRTQVQIT